MVENREKEIDVIGLVVWLFRFFKRYMLVIIAFMILGSGLGAVEFFFSRNYYNTTLIASSPVINNQIVYELIDPVNYYLRNEMYDSISEKLDISIDVAKDIRKIELDTSINMAVKIGLQVYNSENVDLIQEGLMYYLNNIPFVASNILDRREELNIYIDEIDTEIDDLNSMQEAVLSNIQEGEGAKWVSAGNMFSEMMALNDRKLELTSEYNSLEYFKVITTTFIFEAEKNLVRNLILFGLISMFFGLMIAIIAEVRRLAKIKIKEEDLD
jgi:hypothetical protein